VPLAPKATPEGRAGDAIGTNSTIGTNYDAEADERAAIAEHDGGVPACFAFGFGLLQAERPSDIPEMRWRQAIDGAGRFLDRWGAQAAAHGWTAVDLFSRKQSSLAWALDGADVVTLNPDVAVMSDGRQFRRIAPG
jgi:hypothetical protein